MKKVLIPFGFVMLLLVGASFTNASFKTNTDNNSVLNGSVKILNDTPNKVEIHTGSGIVSLNARGGTTSVSCEAGKKISFANKGKKGDLIFTISSDMCGKTVKLSAYL